MTKALIFLLVGCLFFIGSAITSDVSPHYANTIGVMMCLGVVCCMIAVGVVVYCAGEGQ